MAALPPSNTARYFVDYNIGGGETRSFQVRYAAPATVNDARDWCDVLFAILDARLGTGWAITGARQAAAGSNVTLPAPAPAAVTPAGGTLVPALYPMFLASQGRDAVTGRRAHMGIYGLVYNTDATYRFQRGEDTTVDDWLDFIQTPVAGVNISIAGNVVQWYDYINLGFNVYHQRNQRD